MTGQSFAKHRNLLMALGAIALIWSILGVIDQGDQPYSGYWTDGDDTITRIFTDGPAGTAGLMIGDYINSYEGISNTDTKALVERGRPRIGETRTFVVDRNGAEVSADLTYSGLPARQSMLGYISSLLGLIFLFCGLWAYHKVDSKAALVLAVMGVAFGFLIGGGAYLESGLARRLLGVVNWFSIVLGFGSLLHFSLEFPSRKNFLQKKNAIAILYAPAILVALVLTWFFVFTPESSSGLNQFLNVIIGIFAFSYFGLALFSLIQTFRKASGEQREQHGLSLIVLGAVVGLLPLIINFLVNVIAPKVVLPGQEFYFITLALVPITLMLGVLKSSGAEDPVIAD